MADAGKKRKRVASGVESSNKKATQSQATSSCTPDDEDALLPVIAATKGITAPTVPFTAYKNGKEIILQSSEHSRLDFTALPTDDDQAHYFAVVDGSEIEIVPAHHAQLQCIPRIEPVQESPKKSMASQRVALGQEFGTKKAKKAIASKTTNAITSASDGVKDDVQKTILEKIASEYDENEEIPLDVQLASKPIPQPDLNAETVEEVYPLSKLILPKLMHFLSVKEWQEKARKEENILQPHRFTAYRVASIGKTNDVSKLKALRYIGLLLQFHDALEKAGRDGHKIPKKEILAEKLKEYPKGLIEGMPIFGTANRTLGKWQMEYLHTNICALSLYVDNWSTDTSNIRDDLKLDQKTISQYFQELGCKINGMTEKERTGKKLTKAQANTVKMARLKLPLEFPKLSIRGRRK